MRSCRNCNSLVDAGAGQADERPVLEEVQFGPAAPQSQHLEPPGKAWNSSSSSIELLILADCSGEALESLHSSGS